MVQIVLTKTSYNSCMSYIILLVSFLDVIFCLQIKQMTNFGHGATLLRKVCLSQPNCYMVQIVLTETNYNSCMLYILLLVSFLDAIFCLQIKQMTNFGHGATLLRKVCLSQLKQIVLTKTSYTSCLSYIILLVSLLDAIFCL